MQLRGRGGYYYGFQRPRPGARALLQTKVKEDLLVNSQTHGIELPEQDFGKQPLKVRETGHYEEEYIRGFVEKWDELIDWRARADAEGQFFIDQLKKRGQ